MSEMRNIPESPDGADGPSATAPPLRRLVTRTVLYPFALSIVLAVLLVAMILHLLGAINLAEQSDLIISKATLIEKLALDRETGLRAYVITKDAGFLEPYERAEAPLVDEVQALGSLVAAEPAQVARLTEVQADVVDWNQHADQVISVVKSGGDTANLIRAQAGKKIMDKIRVLMRGMIDSETQSRMDRNSEARRAANMVLASAGGLTLLIGLLVTLMVRRQIAVATGVYRRALEIEGIRNRQKAQLLAGERAARSAAEHASRMKDEFLATLSHELRTPLNAIVGWSQLLPRMTQNKDDLLRGLETIERNARLQAQLIDDLLDMSRIVSGKLRLEVQRVDPATFIEAAIETVMPASRAKNIRIDRVLDPHTGPIAGDPNRLQQVIWNLLSNAVKFTPKDGKVQVLLQRINSHIEIVVADTGPGIKPELMPYLFERFRQGDSSTTRRHGGLGLGLAIVKQLVELHGGSIRAQSGGEAAGATFVVSLPMTVVKTDADSDHRLNPRATISKPGGYPSADLTGLRILVVDDEPDARELVKRVLQECHASVYTAGSAADAMPIIDRENPNVLVSDIGMPDMDGYAFLSKVRMSIDSSKMPAIALTAFARSEDRTKALMTGYLAHLAKPVEPSELIATIASIVGRTGRRAN